MPKVFQPVTDSRTADKFVLRLPEGLREELAGIAKKNHRSMNSEIITRVLSTIPEQQSALLDLANLDQLVTEPQQWTPQVGQFVFGTDDQSGAIVSFGELDGTVWVNVDSDGLRWSAEIYPECKVRPLIATS